MIRTSAYVAAALTGVLLLTVAPAQAGERSGQQAPGSALGRDSGWSDEQLDRFHTRLRERSFHVDADAYTYSGYVDPDDETLVLITDAPAEVMAPVVDAYGDAVQVHHGEPAQRQRHDNRPGNFWGGASIDKIGGSGACTSGFTARRSNGAKFMVTAGHCFTTGTIVYSPGGWRWGRFVQHSDFPAVDLGAIRESSARPFSPAVHLFGPDIHNIGGPVVGAADPVVGFTNYCISGHTSGEVCGHTAQSTEGFLCDQHGCTSDLVVTNGEPTFGGDSGGPLFFRSGVNVHIRGIHVGSGGSPSTRRLSYWHPYSDVVSWGFQVVTS